MNLLCIETSSRKGGGIALVRSPHEILAERFTPENKTQGEFLMPAISEVLQEHRLSIKDLHALVVAIGPGSFTGIRVGLATAQGLAKPFHTPVLGVSTLAALALNAASWAKEKGPKARVCPMMDARKKEIYAALFGFEGELPVAKLEEIVAKPQDWLEFLGKKIPKKTPLLFFGDGAGIYADQIRSALPDQIPLQVWGPVEHSEAHQWPAPRNLALVAAPVLSTPLGPQATLLRPHYLRPEGSEFRVPR